MTLIETIDNSVLGTTLTQEQKEILISIVTEWEQEKDNNDTE